MMLAVSSLLFLHYPIYLSPTFFFYLFFFGCWSFCQVNPIFYNYHPFICVLSCFSSHSLFTHSIFCHQLSQLSNDFSILLFMFCNNWPKYLFTCPPLQIFIFISAPFTSIPSFPLCCRIFVVGIGFFSLCFLMTSLGGQFSAKRLGDSPFTIRTEGTDVCRVCMRVYVCVFV